MICETGNFSSRHPGPDHAWSDDHAWSSDQVGDRPSDQVADRLNDGCSEQGVGYNVWQL